MPGSGAQHTLQAGNAPVAPLVLHGAVGGGAQSTLSAGNAPVAPLVLHRVVGGSDHLPLGEPHDRLPCLFHKKKKL